jgi:hypothetical protein
MKSILQILFTLYSLNASAQFLQPAEGGWKDSTGKIVRLNGVSLNGWLSWDGPSWGAPALAESKIYANIAKATSIDFAATFREKIYEEFISKSDIEAIADMEFKCVKIPFHHAFFGRKTRDHKITEEDFLILDKMIDWCKEFGLYVILEMNAAPGGQNKLPNSDYEKNSLWKSSKHQTRAVEIWYYIANRYKNNPTIAGYNLLCQPENKDISVINSLYTRMCDTISKVDNKHFCIVEGAGSEFYKNSKYSIVFGLRIPLGGSKGLTPDELIAETTEFIKGNKITALCTEFGMFPLTVLYSVRKTLQADDSVFNGDIYASWKMVTGEENRPLVNIPYFEEWIQLISGKKNKTGRSGEGIAKEFIENAQYRSVMENRDIEKILRH